MGTKSKAIDSSEEDIIGKNILDLMSINEISELELANALGVSVMTIRRVVSGETEDPRISTLSLIADYFKVSIDSLLENSHMPFKQIQNKKPCFLPILDWDSISEFCDNKNFDLSQIKNWYPLIKDSSLNIEKHAFAIQSKPSMQPRFPKGTLLIINPNESLQDSDIVLIKSKLSSDLSLRELVFDTPKWILNPIINGSEIIFFNQDEHDIIGVVILTILDSRII